MADVHDTPIRRVLSKLKGVKRSDGGWVALCPAHADAEPSLGIDVSDGGKVLMRCHAGCEVEAVVAALGLQWSDLFPPERQESREKGTRKERQTLTLAELCAHKKLPIEFVRALGWADARGPWGPQVEIPYVRRDGTLHRTRIRVALRATEGSRWGSGTGQIVYEPDKGALAQQEGYVVVVEGETDTATLLYAGIPALGVPGAQATGLLEREHFEGLRCAFVVRETDAAGAKFVEGVQGRLAELGLELPLYTLELPGKAKDPSALYQRDPDKFAELMHGAMIEASKPPPEPLDDVWRTLADWGALVKEPPPRRWLLDRPDEECNGARHVGVFPLGKVGMLVAAGGVGKTMALIELALAVATGRKWLDYFGVANPGKVMLALAEEDEEEINRRFFQAQRAMGLTDRQLELAAQNIVALPLAGNLVNLIKSDAGEVTETAVMTSLRKKLEVSGPWNLLILDPLSRFAGFDSEKDNHAATGFISVVESLLRVPGRPSILIAHHTSKVSRTEGTQANAANARGATALTDGVRWVAELTPVSDGTVSLKMVKSNYSMGFDPVTLIRDADHGGYLRVQTPAEAQAAVAKLTEKRMKAIQTMRDLVIKTIAERPGLRSANDVYALIRGNRPAVMAAVRELKMEGFIKSTPDGLKLSERSGLDE